MRRLAALAAVLAVAATAPAASAERTAASKGVVAAERAIVKQRAARKRAVARHRAEVRRRTAARREALADALALVTAAPVPSIALPVPDSAPAPTGSDELSPTPLAPLARTIGITQREFTLSLSRTTVGAGDVTIQVLNRGEDPHDLRVERLDGGLVWLLDELPSFASSIPTVVPLTAGTYRVLCTLPGHAEAGMDTRLTVAG